MRRATRVCLLIAIFVLFIWPSRLPAREDEPFTPYFHWQVGEELFYKVRYAFLTVGTLRFQILRQLQYRGRPVYHCRLYIDSNPAIPLVSIHDIYESYIDQDVYSHHFWSYENKGDHILYTEYDFDYQRNLAHIQVWKWTETDTVLLEDTLKHIPGPVQDGLSILFYARSRVQKISKTVEVQAFVFGELKSAVIRFLGETRPVKVKGHKLPGYYLDGKLKFVGIAGIKEDFKGWFSEDPQAVPLRANMKAIVGSVRVLLESWQKWEAPEPIQSKMQVSKEDSLSYSP